MDFIGQIDIPENIFNLENVKEFILKKDTFLDNSENEELNDEERDQAYSSYEELEEKEYSLYSMYLLVPLLEKYFPKNEEEKYDVTKLYISESTYLKMKEYDTQAFKILKHDIYSEEQVLKEISMLHFMSGFAVGEGLSDNVIYIKENYIRA